MILILLFLTFFNQSTFCIVTGPLSSDFQSWLISNGYGIFDFVRKDYGTQGSYGGFVKSYEKINNNPIIFFHGNSDTALKTNSFSTGWDASIQYFLSNNYSSGELYATSWQDNNPTKSGSRSHTCKDLKTLRKFVEAVLAYTKTSQVSIIAHSMGVTLARKLIIGGALMATDGTCNLGSSIGSRVKTFIAISGANYGLCSCTGSFSLLAATCNKNTGFWPGDYCGDNLSAFCGSNTSCNGADSYSKYLKDLNTNQNRIADHLFSVWSEADDLIRNGDYVFGRPTSLVPSSNGQLIYKNLSHMQTKDLSFKDQFEMITKMRIPKNYF